MEARRCDKSAAGDRRFATGGAVAVLGYAVKADWAAGRDLGQARRQRKRLPRGEEWLPGKRIVLKWRAIPNEPHIWQIVGTY